ncbi:MAG: hypothetical protein WCV62_05305 [Candidatus Peribacteraceae bacterium]|jgi:hypothetical protein
MKTRDELVTMVASKSHERWRADYLAKNPGKPRIKETKDPAFHARGIGEVDISALAYADLPTDWQAENKANAEVVVDYLLNAVAASQPLDSNFVEAASAVAHEKWLERNGADASEHQKPPYAQLSEDEKEKDRFSVRAAVEAYQS